MSTIVQQQSMAMQAVHLGRRIRLDDAARNFVDRVVDKAKSDLCLRLADGYAYLFAFGSVVFIGVESAAMEVFLQDVGSFVEAPSPRCTDDFLIECRPDSKDKVFFERVVLQEVTLQRMRLLSLVLAQSTTLEYFEKQVEQLLDRAAAYTDAIAQGGKWRGTVKEMLAFLGTGLATRRAIVSNLAILDSPDVVWDDPSLDVLFHEHKANFELTARYRTVEHKLRLIHESVEMLVEMSNTRQATVLEMVVVLLIFVEVVLAFFGRGH